MDTATTLPHVNAALNTVTTVLLIIGFALVRSGRRVAHMRVMIAALVSSGAFLVGYLVYHFTAPVFAFRGEGWVRPVYFAMLVSHVVLATVIVPMVVVTVWRAAGRRFDRHRRIARWTLPIWLYVSVTGVMIYLALYHVWTGVPAGGAA